VVDFIVGYLNGNVSFGGDGAGGDVYAAVNSQAGVGDGGVGEIETAGGGGEVFRSEGFCEEEECV